MCKELRVLPQSGGLLDQDSFFVYVLQIYLSASAEKQALDAKKQEAQTRAAQMRRSR